MTNKNRIPEIKFKGFTETWKENELGEIAEFNPKAELPEIFEYVDLESVVGTEMITHKKERKNKAPSRAQRLAQQGDLFYQTVRPYQRNNYLFEKKFKNYVFSTGYAQIRPNGNGYFLLSLVQNNGFVKKVLDNCTGTSYPAINSNNLAKLKIYIPTKNKEQSKIGTFFKNLDQLITINKSKYDKLVNVKKAMLEKMFPKKGSNVPEIRFKGFSGAWKEKKIAELGEIVTGSTPSTQNPLYYSDNGIPWVTPTDITKNIIFHTSRHLTKEGQKVARIVPKNTILVTCIASIGKNTMLGTSGSFNQQINGLISNENENDPNFLFAESAFWSEKMKSSGASGIMQIVNKTEFSKLKTNIPPLPEQHKIGTFFKNLDDLLTLQKRELEKLKNIKRACLEKMFV